MFLSFLKVSIKGRLKCIHMNLLIVVAQIYSCCFSFVLFACKCTIHELNSWVHLWTKIGENSYKLRILWTRISIKKTIELLTVPMQVKNKPNFSLLTQLEQKTFDWCHFWHIRLFFSWIPFPIEILAWKIRPIMAKNNSVWIYHRNHIYDIVFTKKFALFRPFLDDSVDDSIAHKRSLGFSRMLPSHNNDGFSSIFFFVIFCCDYQRFYIFLRDCFAHHSFAHIFRIFKNNLINFVTNLLVSVGIWMC